jgi:uncharacterized protein
MAEYLAPGVYVEETSYRAKSVEGVSTTTTGFVAPCRYGPVEGLPVLVTSFVEFERRFGGLEPLQFGSDTEPNYLAHAVRAFFDNGGKRCYISRIFAPNNTSDGYASSASSVLQSGAETVQFKARYPGLAGNVDVEVVAYRKKNVKVGTGSNAFLSGVRHGDLIEHSDDENADTGPITGLDTSKVYRVEIDESGEASLQDVSSGTTVLVDDAKCAYPISLEVRVTSGPRGTRRTDTYSGLSTVPQSERYIGRVMRTEDPQAGIDPPYDEAAMIFFDAPQGAVDTDDFRAVLANLLDDTNDFNLDGGDDGIKPGPSDYRGGGEGHKATGLATLGEREDIAIVAAPGSSTLGDDDRQAVREDLISHCENHQYRFAILSGPQDATNSSIRDERAKHDTSHAALYYPWVVVSDPLGRNGDTLELPPEGFIAGIYARSDIERGVHKAPANEVVRGALRFNRHVTKGVQDVLNPEGINCLRFFEGRGYLVWGARTMSSDPEWKYVNVRRLFIYLEHSIDRSTQWAVFEPNNHTLWLKVRLTIESFLKNEQRRGALMGRKPEEGFFVKCDRTTMTQQDLDNGRLICLIGVAPTKPAEYVVFRIGQWTADASIV